MPSWNALATLTHGGRISSSCGGGSQKGLKRKPKLKRKTGERTKARVDDARVDGRAVESKVGKVGGKGVG